MKLRVINTQRTAKLVDGKAVATTVVFLADDEGTQLIVHEPDDAIAALFVHNATTEVTFTKPEPPPEPEPVAEDPPQDDAEGPAASAGAPEDPSEAPTPTPRRARR